MYSAYLLAPAIEREWAVYTHRWPGCTRRIYWRLPLRGSGLCTHVDGLDVLGVSTGACHWEGVGCVHTSMAWMYSAYLLAPAIEREWVVYTRRWPGCTRRIYWRLPLRGSGLCTHIDGLDVLGVSTGACHWEGVGCVHTSMAWMYSAYLLAPAIEREWAVYTHRWPGCTRRIYWRLPLRGSGLCTHVDGLDVLGVSTGACHWEGVGCVHTSMAWMYSAYLLAPAIEREWVVYTRRWPGCTRRISSSAQPRTTRAVDVCRASHGYH